MLFYRYPLRFSYNYDYEPRRTPGFRVDARDEGDHVDLYADLAGLERDEIRVSVEDNTLTIGAVKGFMGNTGELTRSFSLEGYDEKGITAEYRNGMLHVTLPKLGGSERRIEIM